MYPGWNVPGAVESGGEPDHGSYWLELERPKDTHRVYLDSVEPVTPLTSTVWQGFNQVEKGMKGIHDVGLTDGAEVSNVHG